MGKLLFCKLKMGRLSGLFWSLFALLCINFGAKAQVAAERVERNLIAFKPQWQMLIENSASKTLNSPAPTDAWEQSHYLMELLAINPSKFSEALKAHLATQQDDGSFSNGNDLAIWVLAAEDYVFKMENRSLSGPMFDPLLKYIAWFEKSCAVTENGYAYPERLNTFYPASNAKVSLDATSHAYLLYMTAHKWALRLNQDGKPFLDKAKQVKAFLESSMFNTSVGCYTEAGVITAECVWPMVVNASGAPNARKVVENYLLNPARFFTQHPVPMVPNGKNASNAAAFWAARGAWQLGRSNACLNILNKALNETALRSSRGALLKTYASNGSGKSSAVENSFHNPMNAMNVLYGFVAKTKID